MGTQSNHYRLFTDGACKGNPGVGGWGSVLVYKDSIKENQGNTDETAVVSEEE